MHKKGVQMYNNNNKNNTTVNGGVGFFGLLQVVFIALKVAKVIDWSWWLIFLPTWINIGIIIIVIFIIVVAAIINARK